MPTSANHEQAALAQRIDALEEAIRGLTAGPEVRLLMLSSDGQRSARAESERKPFHERYGWLLGALGSLAMFLLGFFLKDSVELGLKKNELQLESAKAVQALVIQLGQQTTPKDRVATAIALANFGDLAVPPLIHQIRNPDETGSEAGMEGLRAVGLVDHNSTCAALGDVIGKNVELYPWWSHQRAAMLLGELRCEDGIAALNAYAVILPHRDSANPNTFESRSVESYLGRIQSHGALPDSDVEKVVSAVQTALTVLKGRSP